MTRTHVFAKAAAADLREISRYTLDQWGEAQARRYIEQLDDAAAAVSDGRGVFKDWSDVLPGLRVAHVGRHHIFCLPRPDAPALILAILHERMDILDRLKSRLVP